MPDKSIESYMLEFKAFLETEKGKEISAERDINQHFFQKDLRGKLDDFTTSTLEEVLGHLWSMAVWGNKSYYAGRIVEMNSGGLPTVVRYLRELYAPRDPVETYAAMVGSFHGMGPSSISEALSYLHPDQFIPWNKQTRIALGKLGVLPELQKTYSLTPAQYRAFIGRCEALAGTLAKAGLPGDYYILDFCFYWLAQVAGEAVGVITPAVAGWSHDEIKEAIDKIGVTLGFTSQEEVFVGKGARVDCIWTARIGNLGVVKMVFEVQKSGSIDSLVLNLQKAATDPSVQKIVAVSDASQLERIRHEVEGLKYALADKLVFWDVNDVQRVLEHLLSASDILRRTGIYNN
ncbi:MAG: hypothetical protein NTV26_07965 [Caldiserica bacterium]|nr:hypothetical protein [Caldisericota bacterium]